VIRSGFHSMDYTNVRDVKMSKKEIRHQKKQFQVSMKSILIIPYLMFFFSYCAIAEADKEAQDLRFEFALIGDMPYDGEQEKEFGRLMKEINQADLAFVVHDGDFWFDGLAWKDSMDGFPPCSDETVTIWPRVLSTHLFWSLVITTGLIVTVQNHMPMLHLRGWTNSASFSSRAIEALASELCPWSDKVKMTVTPSFARMFAGATVMFYSLPYTW
jgi:hypothetical protein